MKDERKGNLTISEEPLTKFLGCNVIVEPGSISITNELLIKRFIDEFSHVNLTEGRHFTNIRSPLPCKFKVDDEEPIVDHQTSEYQIYPAKFIGFVSYLSASARPDLRFALHELGKHAKGFTKSDERACVHLLKYLKATEKLGLTYHKDYVMPNKITAFSDASLIGGKAVCASVVLLNGAAIHWDIKKVNSTLKAVSQAELIALQETVDHVVYFRALMCEFGFSQSQFSTPILVDSQISIANIMKESKGKSGPDTNVAIKRIKERV